MQRAFVTGGSGFIGGRLIERLVRDGVEVRALARSTRSAEAVQARGAESAPGELGDPAALRRGIEGCDTVFHAAAHLGTWGSRAEFERDNVGGTKNVLQAARAAGAARVVHVGTEAALLAGEPLIEADERTLLRPDSPALYSATKAAAEIAVREASGGGLHTVIVRPRLVWGPGDTTILPGLVDAVRAGKFAWIGGGRHRTATTHVDNVVEALVRAGDRGAPGAAYFVTDGGSLEFRDFVTRLLATQGVDPGDRAVPAPVALGIAVAAEAVWRLLPLPGAPPLTRLEVWLASQECTLDTSAARRDLGYAPVRTVEDGMDELRRSGPRPSVP